MQAKLLSYFEIVCSSLKDNIYLHVSNYLEGNFLVGPSFELFKVAMLSKKMYFFVHQVYGVTNFIEFANLYSK